MKTFLDCMPFDAIKNMLLTNYKLSRLISEWLPLHGVVRNHMIGNVVLANIRIMIDLDDSDWNEGLIYACEIGNLNMVKLMIEHGADKWNDGLHKACYGNNKDIIELMIKKGAKNLLKGLEIACEQGNAMVFKLLSVSYGVQARYGGRIPYGALYHACNKNKLDMIQLLISMGTDDWDAGLDGACQGEHINIARMMIEKGAQPSFRLLKHVFTTGNVEIIKFIINKIESKHVEISPYEWGIIMGRACSSRKMDVVKLAIESSHGIKDMGDGLDGACWGGNMEIIKFMIDKGAIEWNDGLYRACGNGDIKLVELMIEKGANDWNFGLTGVCESSGNLEIAKLMIKKGANKFRDNLITVCEHGYIELVELLIKNGAHNLNEGLHVACNYGQSSIVELLVENGASDVGYCLPYACKWGDMKLVRLLIKNGG